jgi:tetratricopeptide (TPR) repeat protein
MPFMAIQKICANFFIFLLIVYVGQTVAAAPADPKAEYERGNQYFAKGNYSKAVEFYERVLAGGLRHPEIYNNLGLAYSRMQVGFARAVENFQAAISLDQRYMEAYTNLGSLYLSHNGFDAAREIFGRALAVNPDSAKANFGLGWVYLMQKRDANEAIKYFQKAIEADPNYAEGYLGLGMAYISKGQKVLAFEPIAILRRMNRFDLAKMIEDALGVSPSSAPPSRSRKP